MPKPRRPHPASPDELNLTRDGDDVIIAYADDSVATTHFRLGRERLATMTDDEIIDTWNEHLKARDDAMASYEHIAVEVPPGRPQIELSAVNNQWVPRGHVVRCVVLGSNEDPDEPFVTVDDRDLTLREFARMGRHVWRLGHANGVCSRRRDSR